MNGKISVPNKPCLGIEIDMEQIEKENKLYTDKK
jgi:L-alanine-DL-glutamate epimerase-like enolase superfamily enzyme